MNMPIQQDQKKVDGLSHYIELYEAFDYYNTNLNLQLPRPLITLCRRDGRVMGYCNSNAFIKKESSEMVAEIALNPDHFLSPDEEILRTLVHEMIHLYCDLYLGTAKSTYHCKKWAAKMKEAGLQPSDTGKKGGKETGKSMDDYTIKGGAFDLLTRELLKGGRIIKIVSNDFNINQLITPYCPGDSIELASAPALLPGDEIKIENTIHVVKEIDGKFITLSEDTEPIPEGAQVIYKDREALATRQRKNKTKYTCPECGVNVWGKPNLSIGCGECCCDFVEE